MVLKLFFQKFKVDEFFVKIMRYFVGIIISTVS